MSPVPAVVAAALVVFAATNLDDLLLLVVICSDLRRNYPPSAVLAGQILGFFCILTLSLIGFWSGLVVPEPWMALLGVLPLALGVRQVLELRRHQPAGRHELSSGYRGHPEDLPAKSAPWRKTGLKVAALTLANGSDNVSVYLPLFGRLSPPDLLVTLATFLLALLGLWFLAQWLSQHPRWRRQLQVLGPRLSPLVLIVLGLWLLKGSVLWPQV